MQPSSSAYLDFCLCPFVLPCFAPAAAPQVIIFAFTRCLPWLPLSFVRFRFRFLTTQPLFLLFSFLPVSASQGLLRFASVSFVPLVFPFLLAWFPMHSFRFCLLSILFVSFHPSLLRSHSCSTGASLRFHSGIIHCFRFLSSTSTLGF